MWSSLFPITFLTTIVSATTYNVAVGRTGLTFEPSTLHNVAINDVVNFHFYPTNNSVAESTFDRPCRPKSGGVDDKPIYSGFVPVDSGVASQMWSVTITKTDPIWLYCSQGDHQHCKNGQVMVINPLNNTDQNLEAYMAAAYLANVTSPDEVFGGTLVKDDGGQPDQIIRRPVTTTNSGENVVIVKASTAPLLDRWLQNVSIWGFLAVVFFVTL